MKALWFDETLAVKDVPKPVPPKGESLIRVTMAGICATDREITRGYMDFKGVPGHEFVGIVEDSEDASLKGKRVVGEINCGCGECDMCRRGLQRHCPHRTTLGIRGRNGAFAEYLSLPNENLLEVPASLDDKHAVFTEPLAAALEIAEQIKIVPHSKILIIGDGKLAALIAQVLKLQGAELLVSGQSAKKLHLLQSWGIAVADSPPPSAGFDLVVEASGNPSGWQSAVKAVKPRGTIVLKSTYEGDLNFNPAPLVINEITVVGSRCGRFEPALRLLKNDLIDVESLIDTVFSFDNINEAFEYANNPDTLKVLVEF